MQDGYSVMVRWFCDDFAISLQLERSLVRVPLSALHQCKNSLTKMHCGHQENQENLIFTVVALLCLDLVSFPVLSQIEPQAPLLVVPRVGAGSAQETKILSFLRSFTGGWVI